MDQLTTRERWIARQAYRAGYGQGHNHTVDGAYNGVCEHENDCANDWMDDFGDELIQHMEATKEE